MGDVFFSFLTDSSRRPSWFDGGDAEQDFAFGAATQLFTRNCLFSMDLSVPNSLPAFGFLTVVEDQQHGFFGGYLVLSELGRPLEFHCSTPIFPSPAQRILYGSTLQSYVLGELIGPTLVQKAQLPVQAVLTDLQEMLSLALVWQGKLAWVARTESSDTPCGNTQPQAADLDSPELELGDYRLTGSSTCCWAPEKLSEALSTLVSYIDLEEPFQRIHEAIQEAQRVTEHPAGEADGSEAAA